MKKFKKINLLAFLLLATIFLAGCSKDNEQKNNQEQEKVSENTASIENSNTAQGENSQAEEVVKSDESKETIPTNQESSIKNTTSVDNNKSKEDKKDGDDKKDSDDEKEKEKEKPSPCFVITGNKYSENIFYLGILKLNADCSKNSKEYQWYANGNSVGAGKSYNFYYKTEKISTKNPIEIKLIATSSDGLSASTAKTITFREIPQPTICFNQESSKIKSFKLEQEYSFDASCSTYSEENPITKYSWKFRDGGIDDAVKKDGVKVNYSFSKPSTTWEGGECGGPDDRLEVQLDIETKLGNNSSNIHHYCIDNL